MTSSASDSQALFWEELMKSAPSLMRLDEIERSIEENISTAHTCFNELLEMAPSALILRQFAEFLVEVRDPTHTRISTHSCLHRVTASQEL